MKPWVAPANGIDFRLDLRDGSAMVPAMPVRQARSLPIVPCCYGHFIAGPGHFTHRHQGQPVHQLFITRAGHGLFTVDGREHIAGPGSIALLDCTRPGRYEALSDGWDHEWINFSGPSCEVYHELVNPSGFCVYPLNGDHALPALMQKLRDTLAVQEPAGVIHASALIIRMLDELYRIMTEQQRASEPGGNIARSMRYIEERYDQPVSLDDLAQAACLSKYYYIRAFRRNTGMTPVEYLHTVRVHHAQNLLLTTSCSVEEIALRVGYSEARVLIRQFRQTVGMTPGEYRKTPDGVR